MKKKKTHFADLQDVESVADQPPPSQSAVPPLANEKRVSKGSSAKNSKVVWPRNYSGLARKATEPTTHDKTQQMTRTQRNKYKSMRRQDLIDLHLTLSRHREQLIAQMTNVSNVILELAEAYHELKSSTCVPTYYCELDLLIQESLAAYERRQKSANHPVTEWSLLISKAASAKKRKRPTVIVEPPKRRFSDLYAIPLKQLQHEVADLEADVEVYRRRIALDDRKINLMGEQWAEDKKRLFCFRYFYLKTIIESAITDYRIDRR